MRLGGGSTDGESDANRPRRRTVLGAIATGGALALAGCGDGGGGGSDDGDSGGDGGSSDDSGGSGGGDGGNGGNGGGSSGGSGGGGNSIESMCSVADNFIEELTVVGCQSTAGDGDLTITVTVRNDGDQEAELNGHHVTASIYDASGTSMENDVTGSVSTNYPGVPGTAPGESGEVEVTVNPASGVSVDDIQHYTITLQCRGFSDGVYCS